MINEKIVKTREHSKGSDGSYDTIYRETLAELVKGKDGKTAQEHIDASVTAGAHGMRYDNDRETIAIYNAETETWKETSAGRLMAGHDVEPESGTVVTAGEGAEVFNDYRERLYDENGKPTQGNVASGIRAHAEGGNTTASGNTSHAEGYTTIASGLRSHAEGFGTKASGHYSHAEGYGTTARGLYSHAEGYNAIARSNYSHAAGYSTYVDAQYGGRAVGNGCIASTSNNVFKIKAVNPATKTLTIDPDAFSYTATQFAKIQAGHKLLAFDRYYANITTKTLTVASVDTTALTIVVEEDIATSNVLYKYLVCDQIRIASSYPNSAEGCGTVATGFGAHAEGYGTTASGDYSHAEGWETTASGNNSHAEGQGSLASGLSSHAEGYNAIARSNYSHAAGYSTYVDAQYGGRAVGNGCIASTSNNVFKIKAVDPATKTFTIDPDAFPYTAEQFAKIQAGHKLLVPNYYYANINTATFTVLSIDTTALTIVVEEDIATSNMLYKYLVCDQIRVVTHIANSAEGRGTVATGFGARAEGRETLASGECSHAEGRNTTASGRDSHAEGHQTTASGNYSHAEGRGTTASGDYSHAEGRGTTASGLYSHAEGEDTTASGSYSHAEGYGTTASGQGSHAGGTDCYVDAAGGSASGRFCTVSTVDTVFKVKSADPSTRTFTIDPNAFSYTADQFSKIQAGYTVIAQGYAGFMKIYTVARTNTNNYTIVVDEEISGTVSASTHLICEQVRVGRYTPAYAEGHNTLSIGSHSHAEGLSTIASGDASHAEGYGTIASGYASHAGGEYNVSNSSAYFIIGKGTSDSARANAFRITNTGTVYATGSYQTSGADYAEWFEWEDGNPDREDRRGLMVTMNGEKIRVANADDEFILGIVSSFPGVIGNAFDDQWQGMYVTDIFGTPIVETVEHPEEIVHVGDEEDGETYTIPGYTADEWKLNPDYDSSKPYTPRSERNEWSAVGMVGQLVTIDDGTCAVNGWAKPADRGIVTTSDTRTKYRVIARLDETHVKLLVL